MKLLIFLFTFVFMLSLVSAISYNDCSIYGNCNKGTGTTLINNTGVTNINQTNTTNSFNCNATDQWTNTTSNVSFANIYNTSSFNITQFKNGTILSLNQTWLSSIANDLYISFDFVKYFRDKFTIVNALSRRYKAGEGIIIEMNYTINNVTLDLVDGYNLIGISSDNYINIYNKDEVIFDGIYSYEEAKNAGIINETYIGINGLDTSKVMTGRILEPNHVYWIKAIENCNVTFLNVGGDLPTDTYALADINFVNLTNGNVKNIADAISAGWVDSSMLYSFDPTIGQHGSFVQLGEGDTLSSWKGHFVRVKKDNVAVLITNSTPIPLSYGWNGFAIILNESQERYNISVDINWLNTSIDNRANGTGLIQNWSAIISTGSSYSDTWINNTFYNKTEVDTNISSANTTIANFVNSSGLIKDWNTTGYIANWNSTGWIQNWSAIISAGGEVTWANIVNGTMMTLAQSNNGTLAKWSQVTNGTVMQWSNIVNGTMATWTQVTNGTVGGASWANIVNGTMMTLAQSNNGTLAKWSQVTNGTVVKQIDNVSFGTLSTSGFIGINEINLSGVVYVNSTSGYVGMGTTKPAFPLHVNNSAVVGMLERYDAGTTNSLTGFANRHTTSGDMADGFGTVVNYAIQDNAGVNNYIGNLGMIRDGNDSSGKFVVMISSNGVSSQKFTINSTGVINSSPTYSVTVGGTNRALYIDNTGIIGYVSSSIAGKENIRNYTNTSWIYNLSAKIYDRKNLTTKNEVGLIAEEVVYVNPDLVSYKRNESYGNCKVTVDGEYVCDTIYTETTIPETVSYSKLVVPILIEVQNLKKFIDDILNRLTGAEQDIDDLQTENQRIKECAKNTDDFKMYKECVLK